MSMSLEQARSYVIANRDDGVECPCCDQMVKVYRRRINSSVAYWLIELVRLWEKDQRFYHVSELPKSASRGEEAKLRYWDLIEQEWNDDSTKRRSGSWRPLPAAFPFVRNETRIPRRMLVTNQRCLGPVDPNDLVSIKDCIGSHFDYDALMRGEL